MRAASLFLSRLSLRDGQGQQNPLGSDKTACPSKGEGASRAANEGGSQHPERFIAAGTYRVLAAPDEWALAGVVQESPHVGTVGL